MSGWGGCLDGRDVFVSVQENSPDGAAVADVMTETMLDDVHWSLDGKDADWLSLDEGNIRLNLSEDRVLDREVTEQGRILDQLRTTELEPRLTSRCRLQLCVSLAQHPHLGSWTRPNISGHHPSPGLLSAILAAVQAQPD